MVIITTAIRKDIADACRAERREVLAALNGRAVLPVKLLVMCLAFRCLSPGRGLRSECSTLDSHC
jgi:hypothetical protein